MSEKEPIKIRLSTVLIILLIVIMLIMGYYIYDLSREKETIAKDLEKNKNTVLEPQSEIKDPVVEEKKENKKEDNQDAFETYQENYEKSFKKKIKGYNCIETELLNIPGVLQIGIDANNNAYLLVKKDSVLYSKYSEDVIKENEEYSAEIKVDEDVANVYVCPVGNGGVVDIIFLKKDGTASKIDFDKLVHEDTIECNDIPNIKDAINVIVYANLDEMGLGGHEYYFVDVYGNIVE